MKKSGVVLGAAILSIAAPTFSHAASGYAPAMYGVTEIAIENVVFDDAKSSTKCGLTPDGIGAVLKYAFSGTEVPVVAASTSRMGTMGAARIKLIPQVYTHLDETLGCTSWMSLTALSHEALSISPIAMPREVTVLYWQRNGRVFSGISAHSGKLSETIKAMAEHFTQQYVNDQRAQYMR